MLHFNQLARHLFIHSLVIFSFFFLVPISGNSATFEFLNQVRGIDTGNGLVGCEAVYIRGKNFVGGYSFSDAVTTMRMVILVS